jgi:hypothetical protein
MNPVTRAVFVVLAASCVMALVGQELFYASGIGINLGTFVILALLALGLLAYGRVLKLKPFTCWLGIPCLVSAAGLIFNESRGLDALNIGVLSFVFGLAAVLESTDALPTLAKIAFLSPIYSAVFGLAGLFVPFQADWKMLKRGDRKSKGAPGLWIGALLATPVLLIFGAILANADPMFARLFQFNFQWDLSSFFIRIFLFAFTFFMFSGLLCLLHPDMREKLSAMWNSPSAPIAPPVQVQMEPTEVAGGEAAPVTNAQGIHIFAMFFGLIGVMFLLFIGVQFRYLFGGNEYVLKSAGLTYAQYARNGFFQIVTVAALTIPLLLGGQSSLKSLSRGDRRLFNVIASVLAGSLLMLLASAFYRMNLYVDAYGLSSLRIYVTAGMIWMALILGLYFVFGLRWQLSRYGLASVVAACAVALGVNVMRPDEMIARVNLSRNQKVDLEHLAQLGADAYPTIEASGNEKLIELWWQHFNGVSKDWKSGSVRELQVKNAEQARAHATSTIDRNFLKSPEAVQGYAEEF